MLKLLALALALAACSSGPKTSTPPTNTGETPTGGGAPHTACATNDDCVVVQTTCCDHCNGGKAEAFNKAHADAHKATGCESTMCTELACGPAQASCEAGSCKVTLGKLE
jgi:hypothetical protein